MPASAPNALGRSVLILGDQRNLNILLEAFRGARRFGDWQARLDISDPVLAGRLRALVEDGLLRTQPYWSSPPRHEYRLTERGSALWRVFVALWMWDARWASDEGARRLIHAECGHACTPLVSCTSCAAIGVTAHDTTALTTGDSFDQSNPSRQYRRTRRDDHPGGAHSVSAADLLGDRWSLSVICAAFLGARRFGEFQHELVTIPPLTLTRRLRRFVDQQLLRRMPITAGGRRMEYRLTPKGFDFFPALTSTVAWTNEWLQPGDVAPLVVVHTACGRAFRPGFICNVCGGELSRDAVRFGDRERRRSAS